MKFDTGKDEELIPEFVPTEERFFVVVPSKKFQDLVGRVSSVSEESAIVEGSELLKISAFEGDANSTGSLTMTASNGSISYISTLFNVVPKTTEDIYVPAKKLFAVLKLVAGELTTLKCIGFELHIVSGSSKWILKLPTRPKIREINITEEGNSLEFTASDLKYYLEAVLPAVATGLSRTSMMQMGFVNGALIGCDGTKLHRVEIPDADEYDTSIPLNASRAMVRLLEKSDPQDKVQLTSTPSFISLQTEEESVLAIRSSLPLPDVEKVFISQAVMNDSAAVVDVEDLMKAIKSVKVFADTVFSSISFTTIKDSRSIFRLIVSAEDDIGNTSRSLVTCTFSGKEQISLKLNYRDVINVLNSITSNLVTIRVGKNSKTSKSSAFFLDMDTEFTAVLGQTLKD